MITAIKPVFDRKAQKFSIEVVRDADVLLAHAGYLVFDDAGRALECVKAGQLVSSWTPRKRLAVVEFLTGELGVN